MLPGIKTILYPTDLGPHGPGVYRYAVSLAQAYGAKIILLHASEPLTEQTIHVVNQFLPPGAPSVESIRDEGLAKLRQSIRERLERFYQQELPAEYREGQSKPEIRIVDGPPARVIIEEAKAVSADMIVMGSHGFSALGEIVLGSVAHKVIHKATIPVMVVPFRGI